MKTYLNIRFLSLFWINTLLFFVACHPNANEILLKEFVNSYNLNGRNIVVVDLDKCASCHFKSIIELCSMKCAKLLVLVYATNQAKINVLLNECQIDQSSNLNISFFSKKEIMEEIHQGGSQSLFLLVKNHTEITIKNIDQIEEVYSYCN